MKRIPHLHENRIHVDRGNFRGSMISLPFHFCYATISLQLDVGPIIILLVVGGFAGLDNKWGDVVVSENMCGPIIKVNFMSVKEEDLQIELVSSIGPTKKTCCLYPAIPVHIYCLRVVY